MAQTSPFLGLTHVFQKYTKEELKKMQFERVSEDFYVIALGLPVPTFKGHSLDPPLRSRFQCLNLGTIPFGVAKELCESIAPNVDKSKLERLLSLAYGINAQHGKDGLGLIRLPIENLIKAVGVWVSLFRGNLTGTFNALYHLRYLYMFHTITFQC
jgi:hypothetical protein